MKARTMLTGTLIVIGWFAAVTFILAWIRAATWSADPAPLDDDVIDPDDLKEARLDELYAKLEALANPDEDD